MKILSGISVLFPLLILAPVSIQAATTEPGRSPVITIGQKHTLPSAILGETVDLIVHLPDNYESDAARHPVLLMLGSNYRARFAMAASTLDYMRAQLQLPPIILVGVDLPHGNFGLVPREGADGTAGADRYIEALTREIIPFVDEHFRTNGYRILYGGSNCGIFALYALMSGRLPVQAYVASSPMIGWSRELIHARTRDAFAEPDRSDRFLFLIASDDDFGRVTREFPGYVELLKTSAPPWLRWRAELRVNEGHVPEVDLSFGLRTLFPDYNPPVELSTLQALREHFAGLSSRYGFTFDVPPALLFDVGYDLAAAGDLDESWCIFEFMIEHDPKSARGYAGLAFVQQKRGDAAGALALAERAIELDPQLGLAKRIKNEVQAATCRTPPPAPQSADAPMTAERFAPGIVSTDRLEHSAPAIAPDGAELCWSVVRSPEGLPKAILCSRRDGSGWSQPEVAPFSGRFADDGPAFSPDGARLYFASNRPRADETDTAERSDIWFVERGEGGWSAPRCLSLGSRFSPPRSVAMPSVTRDGTIYFVAFAGSGSGGFEICRARLDDAPDAPPERLDDAINHRGALNWTPWIAPDESTLLFSSNRPGGRDVAGDIYLARRRPDGSWEMPILLDDSVNTTDQERFPAISPDGRHLFFTRPTPGREQDVYWISTARIPALRLSETSPPARPQ